MQIRELFNDDDAVSPVIGVILMVAITVILAAVIGAFVLGFGGGGPSAPTTSWDSANESGDITFTLESSGEDITLDNLEWGGNASGEITSSSTITGNSSGTISAGATITYTGSVGSGDSLSIIWSDGGTSSTLYTHEAE